MLSLALQSHTRWKIQCIMLIYCFVDLALKILAPKMNTLVIIQQRISYHIISLVWRSLLGLAPAYLRDLCCTTMEILGRRSLRSTGRGFLIVPFAHTTTKQNCAFSVVGKEYQTRPFNIQYLWM